MKINTENGVLTLYMPQRVDSSNAADVDREVDQLLQDNPHTRTVMDAEDMVYISSAGLRVVLAVRKKEPELKIVNANSEVYDILDMTGFTEMIPVEKAYRRMVVDGCEIIGQGANGVVCRLDADTIIKVYRNPDSLPDIQKERELARRAFILGVPTAISYDVVKVDEGYGAVFEMLNAQPLAKLMAADSGEHFEEHVRLYTGLLQKIHSTELNPGEMPDMKQVALRWCKDLKEHLPDAVWQKLHALIDAIPEDHHMLHGDYHVKNVMVQNGEALLIDMDTLCMGNPVFEFASMFMAYVGFGLTDPEVVKKFLGLPYDLAGRVWKRACQLYFDTEDENIINRYMEQAMVLGFTRMLRRTIRRNGYDTEEGRQAIAVYQTSLIGLLDRVEKLEY